MTEKLLRYHLVEYLGVSIATFNSGFTAELPFQDSSQSKRTTTMFNWFLPPAYQFPQGFKTDIGEWQVTRQQLNTSGTTISEIGVPPEGLATLRIFLPKGQAVEWDTLVSQFGQPQFLHTGYLTPSGRSFWVLTADQRAFGLKFHVRGKVDTDSLVEKALDFAMITNTVQANDKLSAEAAAMDESYGCFLKVPQKKTDFVEVGYIYRDFKWKMLKPAEGDVLLPLTALLSQKLWASKELRELLFLPDPQKSSMSDWFVSEVAPHFSGELEKSIFESGIHPEMHQQNLTVHLRQGKVIRVIYQDLQDCLYDPVTQFLLASKDGLTDQTDTSSLNVHRSIALPGEILTPETKEKLYVHLADWWRRWLRIFGRYDRVINLISGEDLFATTKFEDAIFSLLQTACKQRGLNTETTKGMDLYQLIGWAQFTLQQTLLSHMLKKSTLQEMTELPPLFENGASLGTVQAPWNKMMLEEWRGRNGNVLMGVSGANKNIVILKGDTENHFYFFRACPTGSLDS